MAEHAILSASGSERWLSCPGSVALSVGLPNDDTEYSTEGTVAHSLVELALKDGVNPYSYVNTSLNGRKVDREMADHVVDFVDCVAGIKASLPGSFVVSEQQVKVTELIWGTADVTIVQPFGELHIIDFKYGAGVFVSVLDNSQLRVYGCGAYEKYKAYGITSVTVWVYQPRCVRGDHPIARCERLALKDLLDWRDTVLIPGGDKAMAGSDELNPGSYCQFCPAKNHLKCPKLKAEVVKAVGGQELTPALKLPSAESLSNQTLGDLFNAGELIAFWLKGVRREIRRRIIDGEKIPNAKAVYGRNTYTITEKGEREIVGALGDGAYETTKRLLCFTSLEAALKKNKVDLKLRDNPELVIVSKSLTVVPDNRPGAAAPLTAAAVFQKQIEKERKNG